MKYLAVLGRQPEISLAELEALYSDVRQISPELAIFSGEPDIARLGGVLKLAVGLETSPLEFLQNLPEGKITLGLSDYSARASAKSAKAEALKFKKILTRHGRSVRVVESKTPILPTATSLHNGLSGKNERKVELIKVENDYYRVIGVQDIDAYTRRDQARPARDAKVGMLPPKLAQILINLCGPLPLGSTILDPFCGTGVVLQEALLMGYRVYGTDASERMIEFAKKNLDWLVKSRKYSIRGNPEAGKPRTSAGRPWRRAGRTRPENEYFWISQGNATSFRWPESIDAVACEGYLGKPFSKMPSEMELKEQKQECGAIILGFLKNISEQIKKNTPIVIAAPAWLRENGEYARLDILDEIKNLGYNVNNKSREGLLYHRDNQIVARDIIILRKS